MARLLKNLVKSPKSTVLALLGAIYIGIGASYWATSDSIRATFASNQAYRAQLSLFDGMQEWAVLFILAGCVAVISAALRKHWIGFFATMLMSVWWGVMFVLSLILTGYTRIVPQILLWSLISVFLFALSSWPEFTYKPGEDHS